MQQRPGLEVLMKSILGCWSGAGGSIHLQVITKGRLSSGGAQDRPLGPSCSAGRRDAALRSD